MLQEERYSREDEADYPNGEGHPVLYEHTDGGGHRWDPPDREQHSLLAGAFVERHVHAKGDPCERQQEQQEPDEHKQQSQQELHPSILPEVARVSYPFLPGFALYRRDISRR
jgi:hypothetical protein